MKDWLIAFDIDDTLITDEGKIDEKLKVLLLTLQENNTLLFSSGRPPQSIKNIINEIGLDMNAVYVCGFNGSLLIKGDNEVFSTSIDDADINRLADFLRSSHLWLQTYEGSTILYEEDNKYTEYEKEVTRMHTKKIKDVTEYRRSYPKLMGLGREDKVRSAFDNVPSDLAGEFHFTITKPFFLEIMAKDVSKGKAIDYFLNNNVASYEKTMAFGDSFNDIEMLKKVKYSVAVDNAIDEVKEVSKYVTQSNNESGVYNYLNHFINGGQV